MAAVFRGVVDLTVPRGGLVVVLTVYFDESERPSGAFCLAGYAFRKSKALAFAREWGPLFADYGGVFHMTDLNARRGAFKGISGAEAHRLCQAAVETVNRHAAFAVGVSCDLNELDGMLPKDINGFEHAYAYFCFLVLMQVNSLAGPLAKGGISYFFEAGHKHGGAANRFLNQLGQIPGAEALHRSYAAHSFVRKDYAPPLQAADLLAWELSKGVHERLTGSGRPVRRSLAALFATRQSLKHLTGEPLRLAMLTFHVDGLRAIAQRRARGDREAN